MHNTTPIPTSLRVVALLFILVGVSSLIDVIGSLFQGTLKIHFGVLALFIGPGLLRLSQGWRTCALVFLWIAMIGAPIIAILLMTASGPLDFKLFGQRVGHGSKELGILLAGLMFVLAVWQARVLTRPDVRRLFGVPGAEQNAAPERRGDSEL
jgi:cytochrome c oxidase subunit IV